MAKSQKTTPPEAPPKTGRTTKIDILIDLLKRPEGAQMAEMQAATGWQAHSVRGVISGTLKKKMKLVIGIEWTDQGRVYHLIESEAN
ncbi:DUF3489 domain-containing protein [Asticcacaulis taihuensis]|uniref:DUF3489 domain-containing protein n=1 Tax=Asticcacaulis taihuensis TaxID=260084 RepID=UPI0026EA2BAF|nr:DUF3489 domain-containing protein [Asticcacaulis taihuensis]